VQLKRALVLVVVLASATAHAERIVAITPLSTLGAEDKSVETRKLLGQIEQAFASLPGTKVVASTQVSTAIDKAKKPQLKQCEGEATCVTEVGKLVGAQFVVTGEVGGLGDSKVVYLKLTDVTAGRELRSTTLAVGANDSPMGAVIRLSDPDNYRGTVKFAFDVTGATVLVNGTKVQLSANKELALPVGTHAVTVTHPQYHNFVKFVEVSYGKTTDVQVAIKQYPIIQHNVQGKAGPADTIVYHDPPMWRRPYVAGTVIVVSAIVLGLAAGWIAHNFPDYDNCRKVGGVGC
jgi:hypothetical protein